jgi:hypothetical protein
VKWNAFYILSISVLVTTATALARMSVADELGQAAPGAISDVQIGIANHLKVAHWAQVRVGVSLASGDAQVIVAAPDNDGVRAASFAPVSVPTGGEADHVSTVYTNVGLYGAPIEISLTQEGETVESRTNVAADVGSTYGAQFNER